MIPDPSLAIPSGAQTYSKASDRYPSNAPRQAIAAHGAYVETEKGYYIDCTSALGPILLGHGNSAVMRAAHRQMLAGASFSLPTKIELELSHRLINMAPGAEMCRFGKNGNDVVNAAVRIARAATGRANVLRCYDPDTEVLTVDRGFVPVSKVVVGELVYTLNPESGEIEPQPVVDAVATNYRGDMLHFASKTMDLLVTPNHKILRGYDQRDDRVEWRLERADSLLGRRAPVSMFCGGTWRGESPETITISDHHTTWRTKGVVEFPAGAFAEFLGFFVTEGCCVKSSDNHYVVKLSQTDGPVKDRMVAVLCEMGLNPIRHGEFGVVVNSRELWEHLRTHCGDGAKNKRLPQYAMAWGRDLLSPIFRAMIDGDGTRSKTGRTTFYSSSPTLTDQCCEIALKLGYSTNVRPHHGAGFNENGTVYHTSIKSRLRRTVAPEYIRPVPYDGMVYCLSVARNHTLFVRRNGHSLWSGNSAYHGHADWAVEEPMAGGVPKSYRRLTHRVIPGDLGDMERHLRWLEPACVVLEPYPSHDPVDPGAGYFREARKLCDEHGTLLILDEMVTGFRCGWPGAVEHMGIEPDLWCGAKALGGGFPITALLGRAKHMRLIETDVFYSTTFAGEAVSIAAAMACLDEMERVGAYAEVEDIGNRIAAHYVIQAVHHGLGDYTTIKGYPSRPVFHWERPDLRAAFMEAVTDHGLLFQGYINVTVSHREVLDKITEALTSGLQAAQALLTKPEVSCA